ncbi:S-adenosyl-L-methionine-dependent methyltransferase [Biscogniauxia marginata]|nr:S-adenosyl-L-methionine-dependent methyltransferase [Biscogniauxia marginata]
MPSIDASSVDALVQQIELIVRHAETNPELINETLRRRLGEAGSKLSMVMEPPHETVHRIGGTPLQAALAHVGIEKGIFKLITSHDNLGVSGLTLAQQTKTDPSLMKRLLRYYQSLGMVSQLGEDSFGPSNITKNLTSPICSVGITFYFQVLSQAFLAVPQLLNEINYKNPTDPNLCAWNIAHQTDEPPWKWLQAHPELSATVSNWMAVHRDGLPSFLDAIDFEQEFGQETTESTPLLVDVGGGVGQQCVAFRQRHPTLPGRVILQDLPQVIAQAESSPLPGFRDGGIEVQAHNFFTPQPVKGARAYYLRNILHNFTDDDCRKILEGIKLSMSQQSVILIDEIVLSETGAPLTASQMDMTMLTSQAARERSEIDWKSFLDGAGFAIVKQCKYSYEYQDAVLVVIPK